MIIVKMTPEWNNAHAYLEDVTSVLYGWIEIPESLLDKWNQYKPFVELEINSEGYLTDLTKIDEIIPDDSGDQLSPSEKRIADLESDNNLLKQQLQAASDQNDFLEDCIAEMAEIVYA